MGTIQHHAIVVTSWDDDLLAKAHEAAVRFVGDDLTTPVCAYRINGGGSFAVLPDGSKEYWDESNRGEQQRADLTDWLDCQRYDDGSSALSWALIGFGELGYQIEDSDQSRRQALEAGGAS